MLLKLGVSIRNLEHHCRRALNVVDQVWKKLGYSESVITSTFEGNHSPGSFHYQDRAFDLRLPSKSIAINVKIAQALKDKLGKDFDIIVESNHIHVEYDPK